MSIKTLAVILDNTGIIQRIANPSHLPRKHETIFVRGQRYEALAVGHFYPRHGEDLPHQMIAMHEQMTGRKFSVADIMLGNQQDELGSLYGTSLTVEEALYVIEVQWSSSDFGATY